MKKLSAYTVASNCTDLTDIRDGIAEIHEAMKTCVESGKHIPSFYVSRLAKLETKKKKLEKRTQVHMTVTIRFFIDDDTLTMAVRHCLFFKLEPTRQNVMKAIRDAVLNNGRSILDFPEAWGEDLMDVSFFDVENAMKKAAFLIRPINFIAYFSESKVTVGFLASGSFFKKEPKNFEYNLFSSSNLCIRKKIPWHSEKG